jgi:cytochrome o ubiquinol oxidase subunit 2
MSKKVKIIILILVILDVLIGIVAYFHSLNFEVFNPKGPIAAKERNLMYFALALSLVVVVPVFMMTFIISWKYRESNTKAKYTPDWDHSVIAETTWWMIPTILIFILSVVAWNASHTLDPFRPISSTTKPLSIQVVALDWKWLFIYPKQNIATVNYFAFPKNTPLNFQITSDAPMNSFWIPQLGGQIYAMPGMSTQLHLMATSTGSFRGSSANISGEGFAGMDFIAQSVTQNQFNQWVNQVAKSSSTLNQTTYQQLQKPSENNPSAFYVLSDSGLYNDSIMKYMSPVSDLPASGGYSGQMNGMDMQ